MIDVILYLIVYENRTQFVNLIIIRTHFTGKSLRMNSRLICYLQALSASVLQLNLYIIYKPNSTNIKNSE